VQIYVLSRLCNGNRFASLQYSWRSKLQLPAMTQFSSPTCCQASDGRIILSFITLPTADSKGVQKGYESNVETNLWSKLSSVHRMLAWIPYCKHKDFFCISGYSDSLLLRGQIIICLVCRSVPSTMNQTWQLKNENQCEISSIIMPVAHLLI
jgi:hypothetical protein